MPKLMTVLDMLDANQVTLTDALARLRGDKMISRTQWIAFVERVLPLLPAHVTIQMRSPKGVVIVRAAGASGSTMFALDHRAKEKWVSD